MKAWREIDEAFFNAWFETDDCMNNVPISDALGAYCMGDEL